MEIVFSLLTALLVCVPDLMSHLEGPFAGKAAESNFFIANTITLCTDFSKIISI